MSRLSKVVLISFLIAACSDGRDRSGTPPGITSPSLSVTSCNATGGFCDSVQTAIDELTQSPSRQCSYLGEQAQKRFDDPHSAYNAFERSRGPVRYTLDALEEDRGGPAGHAPQYQGFSFVATGGANLATQIALNEADLAGFNPDAYATCP